MFQNLLDDMFDMKDNLTSIKTQTIVMKNGAKRIFQDVQGVIPIKGDITGYEIKQVNQGIELTITSDKSASINVTVLLIGVN